MVIWGHAVRGRPAAGWCAGVGHRSTVTVCHPPARDLPPSAKTCHDLPRTVSFEEPFRYAQDWSGRESRTSGASGCVGLESGYVDKSAQRDRCLGGPWVEERERGTLGDLSPTATLKPKARGGGSHRAALGAMKERRGDLRSGLRRGQETCAEQTCGEVGDLRRTADQRRTMGGQRC